MKKLFLIFIFFIVCGCTNSDKDVLIKYNDIDLKIMTDSFTVGDVGTDIKIKFINNGYKEQNIKKIKIILLDGGGKIISNITKDINIKVKSNTEKVVDIFSSEKYNDVANLEYEVYK